jgi:hypothetical protein
MRHIVKPVEHRPDHERQKAEAFSMVSPDVRWGVKTKIHREVAGSYEIRICLIHVRDSVTDVCDLPSIGGFRTPTLAAAYVLDWMDAWSGLNRPSRNAGCDETGRPQP